MHRLGSTLPQIREEQKADLRCPGLLAASFAQANECGDVMVAVTRLEASESILLAALSSLDQEERQRAARFAFDHDRHRFVLSHFALRRLLSDISETNISQLRFATEPLGRPYLQTPSGIDFNMSHASDMAAYAVSGTCRVGIDVEMIAPSASAELARCVLTPVELDALKQFPAETHPSVFFHFWTAKEAFLKLHGLGFTMEPQSVNVDLNIGVARCSTPKLAPARIVWLPAGKRAVCALATLNVVGLYDVSDWLTRSISILIPGIDSSSYCKCGSIRQEQNLENQHITPPSLS